MSDLTNYGAWAAHVGVGLKPGGGGWATTKSYFTIWPLPSCFICLKLSGLLNASFPWCCLLSPLYFRLASYAPKLLAMVLGRDDLLNPRPFVLVLDFVIWLSITRTVYRQGAQRVWLWQSVVRYVKPSH